jgi:hypothetical protein
VIRPVHIRHIVDGDAFDPGAVPVFARYMVPQDRRGVNGRQGFQSGQNNRKLREEADFTLVFPNDVGGDGVMHRDRFRILADTGSYRIGDEWIEVYEGDPPGGDLVAVVTPVDYTINRTSIELHCKDALITQTHSRETAGGLQWIAAPRDVFDHYTSGWEAWAADDFPRDGRFSYSTSVQTTADGRWSYQEAAHSPETAGTQIDLTSTGGD